MISLTKRLVLALALLLSQAAVAEHDIHCLGEEHGQTCEVYFTQDQSATGEDALDLLEREAYGLKPSSSAAVITPVVFISSYLSRAPPHDT